MVIEGDSTWGGERTIQNTDHVLYNYTPLTYIILLTSITSINSIKKKETTGCSADRSATVKRYFNGFQSLSKHKIKEPRL